MNPPLIFAPLFDGMRSLLPPDGFGDAIFLTLFASVIFMINAIFAIFGGLMERKIIARAHSRIGPQYTGPGGLFQTIADMLKFLPKEMIFPKGSDTILFRLAPILMILAPFTAYLILPIGSYTFLSSDYSLVLALALLGVTPIAVLMGAWASNSKYSTLGGLRAAGMTMSYEVLVAVAAASIALSAGTLDIGAMVGFQDANGWFLFLQPVAAVLFIIGSIASVERNPFDLVEAESELVSGWKTEYGGVYFSLTLLGEYLKLLATGFLFAALFMGGHTGALGDIGFLLKAGAFIVLMFYIRATAIRLRMDQVFTHVWRTLIPLAVLNLLVTIVVINAARWGLA